MLTTVLMLTLHHTVHCTAITGHRLIALTEMGCLCGVQQTVVTALQAQQLLLQGSRDHCAHLEVKGKFNNLKSYTVSTPALAVTMLYCSAYCDAVLACWSVTFVLCLISL
jgi:hypothetical protein